MENCEKLAEMFPKKRKNAQILLKSQLSAQECWKCKIVLQIRKSAEKVPSAIGTGLTESALKVVASAQNPPRVHQMHGECTECTKSAPKAPSALNAPRVHQIHRKCTEGNKCGKSALSAPKVHQGYRDDRIY